jgi:hypothetical protein
VDKGIEPQIFMLRWLRLLFCREFHIDDTLTLWTAFLVDSQAPQPETQLLKYNKKPGKGNEGVPVAEASSMALPLVDFFAVAMIMYLKSQLLQLDENGCLMRLMKYPTDTVNISTLINLAHQLRSGTPAHAQTAPVAPASSTTQSPPALLKSSSPPLSPSIPNAAPADDAKGNVTAGLPPQSAAVSTTVSDPLSVKSLPDGSLATQLLEMRRKVEKLEQEKVAIATKGREFIAKKTAEFQAKIAELENRADGGAGGAVEEVAIAEAGRQQAEADAQNAKQMLAEANTAYQDLIAKAEELTARLQERDTAVAEAEAAAAEEAQRVRAAEERTVAAAAANKELSEQIAELKEQLARVSVTQAEAAPAVPEAATGDVND